MTLCRVFCQSTGFGGTIKEGHDVTKVKNWQMFDHGILPLYLSVCFLLLNSKVETMEKKKERLLTIKFNADTAAQMRCLRLRQVKVAVNLKQFGVLVEIC